MTRSTNQESSDTQGSKPPPALVEEDQDDDDHLLLEHSTAIKIAKFPPGCDVVFVCWKESSIYASIGVVKDVFIYLPTKETAYKIDNNNTMEDSPKYVMESDLLFAQGTPVWWKTSTGECEAGVVFGVRVLDRDEPPIEKPITEPTCYTITDLHHKVLQPELSHSHLHYRMKGSATMTSATSLCLTSSMHRLVASSTKSPASKIRPSCDDVNTVAVENKPTIPIETHVRQIEPSRRTNFYFPQFRDDAVSDETPQKIICLQESRDGAHDKPKRPPQTSLRPASVAWSRQGLPSGSGFSTGSLAHIVTRNISIPLLPWHDFDNFKEILTSKLSIRIFRNHSCTVDLNDGSQVLDGSSALLKIRGRQRYVEKCTWAIEQMAAKSVFCSHDMGLLLHSFALKNPEYSTIQKGFVYTYTPPKFAKKEWIGIMPLREDQVGVNYDVTSIKHDTRCKFNFLTMTARPHILITGPEAGSVDAAIGELRQLLMQY